MQLYILISKCNCLMTPNDDIWIQNAFNFYLKSKCHFNLKKKTLKL